MSSPRTKADSKVSRPTTAPIISRGPPLVYFSGRLRCRIRPTAPPAKTAAVTASAKISGFIVVPPKDGPPKHVWWPFANGTKTRLANRPVHKPGDAFDPQELQATFLARCGNM